MTAKNGLPQNGAKKPDAANAPFWWRGIGRKIFLVALASAVVAWVVAWLFGLRGFRVFASLFLIVHTVAMSLVGALVVRVDKQRAGAGAWRVPERTILAIAAGGGGLGVLHSMYRHRHKTRRMKFVLGVPLILAVQAAVLVYLFFPGHAAALFRMLF